MNLDDLFNEGVLLTEKLKNFKLECSDILNNPGFEDEKNLCLAVLDAELLKCMLRDKFIGNSIQKGI